MTNGRGKCIGLICLLALTIAGGLSAAMMSSGADDKPEFRRRWRAIPPAGHSGGGFVLDTNAVYVPAAGDAEKPDVAFDGSTYLAVWLDSRSGIGTEVWAARTTREGSVLDPAGFDIGSSGPDAGPAVAAGTRSFLVVWQDQGGPDYHIYGMRVTSEGTLLDTPRIPIATAAGDHEDPDVASDGNDFVAVWLDWRVHEPGIYGTRVSSQGMVLDTLGFPICPATADMGGPAICFDGTNYLVAWSSAHDIYAARVTRQGRVLDSVGIPVSKTADYERDPAVGSDGSSFLVVWERFAGNHDETRAARVSSEGVLLDSSSIAISISAYEQSMPGVTFDGVNFVVVWTDERTRLLPVVCAARVTSQGALLDTLGVQLSEKKADGGTPAVASEGASSLVVWTEYPGYFGSVSGARITRQGTVIDSPAVMISTAANAQSSPGIGFDGTNYLIAWEDYRQGQSQIYATRMTPQGNLLDPFGMIVSGEAKDPATPVAASDGTNYLVAWQDHRGNSSDIYAARVTSNGTLLDSAGIAVSTAAGEQTNPVVAFDGTGFVVAWEDFRSGSDPEVYAARVNSQGVVLDPAGILVSSATHNQSIPAITSDGAVSFITWQDTRPGSWFDISGARVTPQGVVLDTSVIAVSRTPGDEWSHAAAFDGTNYLVVWQAEANRWDEEIRAARVSRQGQVLDSTYILVSKAANPRWAPTVCFNGQDYVVAWTDARAGDATDIYGAKVSPDGAVTDSGPLARQDGIQQQPALARGPGNQSLLVYSGWTGWFQGRVYNSDRIWSLMNPCPGVQETSKGEVTASGRPPTFVHGVLMMPVASSLKPQASSCLLDISGRKVMGLVPGANDVSRVAPGVYFVRDELQASGHMLQAVRKVILTR